MNGWGSFKKKKKIEQLGLDMFSIKKNETTFLYKIDGGAIFISAYIGFSCKHIYLRIFQTLGAMSPSVSMWLTTF